MAKLETTLDATKKQSKFLLQKRWYEVYLDIVLQKHHYYLLMHHILSHKGEFPSCNIRWNYLREYGLTQTIRCISPFVKMKGNHSKYLSVNNTSSFESNQWPRQVSFCEKQKQNIVLLHSVYSSITVKLCYTVTKNEISVNKTTVLT